MVEVEAMGSNEIPPRGGRMMLVVSRFLELEVGRDEDDAEVGRDEVFMGAWKGETSEEETSLFTVITGRVNSSDMLLLCLYHLAGLYCERERCDIFLERRWMEMSKKFRVRYEYEFRFVHV